MGFDTALAFVLSREGGYVDDPDDLGGATNKGITQRTYDSFRAMRNLPLRDVQNIPDDDVRTIYRARYWDEGRCEKLPEKLALVHFDACVNHGVTAACRLLQKVVGVAADGIIGHETLAAIEKIDLGIVARYIELYIELREELYDNIVRHKPSQAKFRRGWHNRMVALGEAAESTGA